MRPDAYQELGLLQMSEKNFYLYHPDYGVEWYETEAEVLNACDEIITIARDNAIEDGEWNSTIEELVWGSVKGRVKPVAVTEVEDESGNTETSYDMVMVRVKT